MASLAVRKNSLREISPKTINSRSFRATFKHKKNFRAAAYQSSDCNGKRELFKRRRLDRDSAKEGTCTSHLKLSQNLCDTSIPKETKEGGGVETLAEKCNEDKQENSWNEDASSSSVLQTKDIIGNILPASYLQSTISELPKVKLENEEREEKLGCPVSEVFSQQGKVLNVRSGDKTILKTMKKIKKIDKKMSNLKNKQKEELLNFYKTCEEEKDQLEKAYRMELAVVRIIYNDSPPIRAHKLKVLSDLHSKEFDEHKRKVNENLGDFLAKQQDLKNKEEKKLNAFRLKKWKEIKLKDKYSWRKPAVVDECTGDQVQARNDAERIPEVQNVMANVPLMSGHGLKLTGASDVILKRSLSDEIPSHNSFLETGAQPNREIKDTDRMRSHRVDVEGIHEQISIKDATYSENLTNENPLPSKLQEFYRDSAPAGVIDTVPDEFVVCREDLINSSHSEPDISENAACSVLSPINSPSAPPVTDPGDGLLLPFCEASNGQCTQMAEPTGAQDVAAVVMATNSPSQETKTSCSDLASSSDKLNPGASTAELVDTSHASVIPNSSASEMPNTQAVEDPVSCADNVPKLPSLSTNLHSAVDQPHPLLAQENHQPNSESIRPPLALHITMPLHIDPHQSEMERTDIVSNLLPVRAVENNLTVEVLPSHIDNPKLFDPYHSGASVGEPVTQVLLPLSTNHHCAQDGPISDVACEHHQPSHGLSVSGAASLVPMPSNSNLLESELERTHVVEEQTHKAHAHSPSRSECSQISKCAGVQGNSAVVAGSNGHLQTEASHLALLSDKLDPEAPMEGPVASSHVSDPIDPLASEMQNTPAVEVPVSCEDNVNMLPSLSSNLRLPEYQPHPQLAHESHQGSLDSPVTHAASLMDMPSHIDPIQTELKRTITMTNIFPAREVQSTLTVEVSSSHRDNTVPTDHSNTEASVGASVVQVAMPIFNGQHSASAQYHPSSHAPHGHHQPIHGRSAPREGSHVPISSNPDPLEFELEWILVVKEQTDKMHVNMKLHLESECKKELSRVYKKYQVKFQEAEAAFLSKKKSLEEYMDKLHMNKLLADALQTKYMNTMASGPPVWQQACRNMLQEQQLLKPFSPEIVCRLPAALSASPRASCTPGIPIAARLSSVARSPVAPLTLAPSRPSFSAVPSSLGEQAARPRTAFPVAPPLQRVHDSSELFSIDPSENPTLSFSPVLNIQRLSGIHGPAPHLRRRNSSWPQTVTWPFQPQMPNQQQILQ